jgi:ADP-dependent phosphofructokinase/glucokinase
MAPIPEVIAEHPGGWSVVSCPAPYLKHPRSTVGLGDSFTAGTMLIHSQGAYRPVLAALLPGFAATLQES